MRYKVADIVFDAQFIYEYSKRILSEYEYCGQDQPCFSVDFTDEDVAQEQRNAPELSVEYLESLALFRKICEYALECGNGIIFHSSAIMVDGNAYLFTAPSGTGKSTHTRLWRELLGDRAKMVNDDKPIIRYVDGEFYVYGTPWRGKHGLGENCRAKLKAICHIYQNKENVIKKASIPMMLGVILNQTMRPKEQDTMDKLLVLISKMIQSVSIYSLGCNMQLDAAKLSYTTMSGEEL